MGFGLGLERGQVGLGGGQVELEVFLDEGGEQLAFLDCLPFENRDRLDDSVHQSRSLGRQRSGFHPARGLELDRSLPGVDVRRLDRIRIGKAWFGFRFSFPGGNLRGGRTGRDDIDDIDWRGRTELVAEKPPGDAEKSCQQEPGDRCRKPAPGGGPRGRWVGLRGGVRRSDERLEGRIFHGEKRGKRAKEGERERRRNAGRNRKPRAGAIRESPRKGGTSWIAGGPMPREIEAEKEWTRKPGPGTGMVGSATRERRTARCLAARIRSGGAQKARGEGVRIPGGDPGNESGPRPTREWSAG